MRGGCVVSFIAAWAIVQGVAAQVPRAPSTGRMPGDMWLVTYDEARIQALIRDLKPEFEPDLNVEQSYVVSTSLDILARLGDRAQPAVPGIAELLKHPDWRTKLEAARTLSDMNAETAAVVRALGEVLTHDDPRARAYVAGMIGGLALPYPNASCWGPVPRRHVARPDIGEQAIPLLLPALKDSVAEVRLNAIDSLGRIGSDAGGVVPTLSEALEDQDATIRTAAATSLKYLGSKAKAATPALVRAINDRDRRVAVAAAGALREFDTEDFLKLGFPFLLATIRDKQIDADARREAKAALSNLGVHGKAAVPTLCKLLKDPDVDVRLTATGCLSFGPGASDAVAALIEALGDSSSHVRGSAARALGEMGPAAAPAVSVLIERLSDFDQDVRSRAAYALGSVGPAAKAAIPTLLPMLDEGATPQFDPWIPCSAAWALGGIGQEPETVVPALIAKLRHNKSEVRAAAAGALGQFGERASAATPDLIGILKRDDYQAVQRAATALEQIGPPAVDAAVASLIEALTSASSDVRRTAAFSLPYVDVEAKSVPHLLQIVREETSLSYAGARVLGMMGPKSKAAVPTLVEVFNDQTSPIRREAAEALRAIDPVAADNAGVL